MKPNLITNERMVELLSTSPAPRVTREHIESRIKGVQFTRFGETVTVCKIHLDNEYFVLGESACVNPENYNQELGEKISYDNAFNKLWPLFGFLLAEQGADGSVEVPSDRPPLTDDTYPRPVTGKEIDTEIDKADNNEKILSIIRPAIERVHKDCGVPSDISNAVHTAISEVLADAA